MFRTTLIAALATAVYGTSIKAFAAEDIVTNDEVTDFRNKGWERRSESRLNVDGEERENQGQADFAKRAEAWAGQAARYAEQ